MLHLLKHRILNQLKFFEKSRHKSAQDESWAVSNWTGCVFLCFQPSKVTYSRGGKRVLAAAAAEAATRLDAATRATAWGLPAAGVTGTTTGTTGSPPPGTSRPLTAGATTGKGRREGQAAAPAEGLKDTGTQRGTEEHRPTPWAELLQVSWSATV